MVGAATGISSISKSFEHCERDGRHSFEVHVIWRITDVREHNTFF